MKTMTHPAPRPALVRALPLLAILAAAVVGYLTLRDALGFEALRDNREALLAFRDANFALTALVFVAVYVAIVAFSLPGATAATLGATAIFLAARWGLGESLARRMDASSGRIGAIKQGIDENQWSMLFLIRLVPAVPFFVANLLPALVGVPLRRFVVSTFLGIIPGGVVYTSVGAGLGEVFARGETPDLGIIFEPRILLPLLGLCLLAALPLAIKALRGGKTL
jgi:uncharacterized membrane protein YdjX (TVP38/TMEM64 family)